MAGTAQLLPRRADEPLSANRWKPTAPPGRPAPRRQAGHRPAPGQRHRRHHDRRGRRSPSAGSIPWHAVTVHVAEHTSRPTVPASHPCFLEGTCQACPDRFGTHLAGPDTTHSRNRLTSKDRRDAGRTAATSARQEWACIISLRRRTGRYGATSQASRPTSITANSRRSALCLPVTSRLGCHPP